MPAEHLHEPWRSFLRDIDTQLAGPTEIHCLGGFVVAEYYGLSRPTSDVDVIQVRGASDLADVQRIAGKGSPLAKKHHIYIDIVMVADVPERYEERLIDVYAGEFRNLRVRVFEKHDLALAKLGRNQDYDREDVRRLAQGPGLEIAILESGQRVNYYNDLVLSMINTLVYVGRGFIISPVERCRLGRGCETAMSRRKKAFIVRIGEDSKWYESLYMRSASPWRC